MDKQTKATPKRPEGEGSREMLLRMNDSHKPLRDWAFQYIEWTPEMRILDIGCGGGATIADMLILSPESKIDGIDYSPDSVKLSKDLNKEELDKRVFIIEGDVSELPYESNTYDLVTAVETIYFWPDLKKALSGILKVLKPAGSFAVLCEIDRPELAEAWGDIRCELTVYRPDELKKEMLTAGFSAASSEVKENGYMLVVGRK